MESQEKSLRNLKKLKIPRLHAGGKTECGNGLLVYLSLDNIELVEDFVLLFYEYFLLS